MILVKELCNFTIVRSIKFFYGKWVGSAFDGDIATGFLVIAQTQDECRSVMREIVKMNPHKVNIIVSTLSGENTDADDRGHD